MKVKAFLEWLEKEHKGIMLTDNELGVICYLLTQPPASGVSFILKLMTEFDEGFKNEG